MKYYFPINEGFRDWLEKVRKYDKKRKQRIRTIEKEKNKQKSKSKI